MAEHTTLPSWPEGHGAGDLERIVVAASWTDPRTGQTFVHKDLVPTAPDWQREEHVGPMERAEFFGDVESWARYVATYAGAGSLLTWSAKGLAAVLDYPASGAETARCQWTAQHPFVRSPEWIAWERFANGQAVSQKPAVERLEDLAEDITDPPPADLVKLLRDLRANATAKAETEIRPDGTTSISFSKDTSVAGKAGSAELPALIQIAIPVLAGDTTRWGVKVRMRASVDSEARLTLRFSLLNAERVLEAVFAEAVTLAEATLGGDRHLLRAAG